MSTKLWAIHPDILTASERQTYHAIEALAALGDATLCRMLVTRAPVHAKDVMSLCVKHREAPSADVLARQIMRQAMSQADSILHREMASDGLGQFVRLVDVALGNPRFIESRARPLSCLRFDEGTPLTAKACAHTLSVASRAYLAQGADTTPTRALGGGFESLQAMAMWPLWRAARESGDAFVHSPAFEMAQAYSDAVMDLCEGLISRPMPEDAPGFDQERYLVGDDPTLWGRAAEGVIGVLRLASHPEMTPDSVRAVASSVWFRVDRNGGPHYQGALAQIQGRLRCAFLKAQHPLIGPLQTCSAALVVLVGLVDREGAQDLILSPADMRAHLLRELSGNGEPGQERRLLPRGYRYNAANKSIVIEASRQGEKTREISLKDGLRA